MDDKRTSPENRLYDPEFSEACDKFKAVMANHMGLGRSNHRSFRAFMGWLCPVIIAVVGLSVLVSKMIDASR